MSSARSSCGKLVVSEQFVYRGGEDPARGKDADDDKAQHAKVVVSSADRIPDSAIERQPMGEDAGGFDAADDQRHEHRYEGDNHIVIELSHGLDERPTVGAEHQNAVGCIE